MHKTVASPQTNGFLPMLPLLHTTRILVPQKVQNNLESMFTYKSITIKDDLTEYQSDFLMESGYFTDQPIRRYGELICKQDFILHRLGKIQTLKSLEMLLSDQTTLFSPDFSIYQLAHAFLREQSIPQLIKNENIMHERCLKFALNQVRNKENRPLFKDILHQFASNQQGCVNQILDIIHQFDNHLSQMPDFEAIKMLTKANELLPGESFSEFTIFPFVDQFLRGYRQAYNDIVLKNSPYATNQLCEEYIHEYCLHAAQQETLEISYHHLFADILYRFAPDQQERSRKICCLADDFISYWKSLPHNMDAIYMLEKSKELMPGAMLTEQTIFPFVNQFLSGYQTEYRSIMLIQNMQETGHYKPRYTPDDQIAAQQYVNRYTDFYEKRTQLAGLWVNIPCPFIKNESFSSNPTNVSSSLLSSSSFNEIAQGINKYLETCTRSRSPNAPAPLLKHIISGLMKVKPEYFPFRALILCVVGGGSLWRCSNEVPFESITTLLNHVCRKNVYRQKPSFSVQHLERSRLLFSLCKASKITNIEQNLALFLKYHGAVLQSKEEVALWEEFLTHYELMDSPVSLPLRYAYALQECLPLQCKYLRCFEPGSLFHCDGFDPFVNRFPHIISEFVTLEHQKSIPQNLRKDYLREWSATCLNVSKMKSICRKIVPRLNWTILEPTEDLLSQDIPNFAHRRIDLDELKLLMAEIAVRSALSEDSRKVLFEKLTDCEEVWREKEFSNIRKRQTNF